MPNTKTLTVHTSIVLELDLWANGKWHVNAWFLTKKEGLVTIASNPLQGPRSQTGWQVVFPLEPVVSHVYLGGGI